LASFREAVAAGRGAAGAQARERAGSKPTDPLMQALLCRFSLEWDRVAVARKRYYTFMIDPELADALKAGKTVTGHSEGHQIREALKDWFERVGVTVKPGRRRPQTRRRR